jgi:hypothetical protein
VRRGLLAIAVMVHILDRSLPPYISLEATVDIAQREATGAGPPAAAQRHGGPPHDAQPPRPLAEPAAASVFLYVRVRGQPVLKAGSFAKHTARQTGRREEEDLTVYLTHLSKRRVWSCERDGGGGAWSGAGGSQLHGWKGLHAGPPRDTALP